MFVGIDGFNITDDLVKVAANTISAIAFRRGAVDRACHEVYMVFNQAFENFVPGMIEIGAVPDRNSDTSFVSMFENPKQLRIEKHFSVV